ncbi:MAG: Aryl-alcohol dehydrogenase [Syntrophaceae bacterium PtaU1.Bin231]|jgi:D-arabinose 1-dehydrogenase-like Zn-dependent alcohol dehydrogenase|nr:MAG: Aryl-alcohol dehydrogenase [Syntrophaceae bacterium PtaB.Bin038]OPY92919.1 MAG: Aryl-alcohol dehydrogenase [Syntrophaceae bacterium PtaU1.Bin231]
MEDNGVLVRVIATGICHIDIRYVDDGYEDIDGPLVLGHEGAGLVEADPAERPPTWRE